MIEAGQPAPTSPSPTRPGNPLTLEVLAALAQLTAT